MIYADYGRAYTAIFANSFDFYLPFSRWPRLLVIDTRMAYSIASALPRASRHATSRHHILSIITYYPLLPFSPHRYLGRQRERRFPRKMIDMSPRQALLTCHYIYFIEVLLFLLLLAQH